MKEAKPLMGTVITIEIADSGADLGAMEKVFSYFKYVDEKFSPFKEESEITKINQGKIAEDDWSEDMKEIFKLAEITKIETDGFFDIMADDGRINPSGIVKGWSIHNAARILLNLRYKNFYVNAGGDIEAYGKNSREEPWSVGIKNPFNQEQIVKVLRLKNAGIATSGTYIRGQHIYNPFKREEPITEIASLTVIGPNVYEADRFATACFAMGRDGIFFIEKLKGFEGYMIDKNGRSTYTSNFQKYIDPNKNEA